MTRAYVCMKISEPPPPPPPPWGYLLSVRCNKMQGYENVIQMHLSVFSPRAGGVGVMQGDLTTNKYPTHGIRTPNPWGGKLRYFFWEFLYQIITDLTTRPRDFRHYIHVFTQGRGIKPQFVLVVFCGSPSRRKHCQVHYVMSHRLMSGYVVGTYPINNPSGLLFVSKHLLRIPCIHTKNGDKILVLINHKEIMF